MFDIRITPVLSECDAAELEVKLRLAPSVHCVNVAARVTPVRVLPALPEYLIISESIMQNTGYVTDACG